MTVLVHTELRGIQAFLYGTRRLRDSVTRSHLVRDAARRDSGPLREAVASAGATVLSAAGGASTVFCNDTQAARRFATTYSAALLEHSAALDPVVTLVEADSLSSGLRDLPGHASRRAGVWTGDLSSAGFGLTRSCDLGGGAAETLVDDDEGWLWLSDQAFGARQGMRQVVDDFDARFLPSGPPPGGLEGWRLPLALDELGRSTGERSDIAVIHLDINALGARRTDWLRSRTSNDDGSFIEALATIETAVDHLMQGLLRHLVDVCAQAVTVDPAGRHWFIDGFPADLHIPLTVQRDGRDKRLLNLPLRPVLSGGDDLTVICDARLTWSLAATALGYLDNNHPSALTDLAGGWEETLTAGVGAAVVDLGFPFDTAYATAAALCERAKTQARPTNTSSFDWHIGNIHPASVATLAHKDNRLTARPYESAELQDLLGKYLDASDQAGPTSLRSNRAPDRARPWAQRRTWLRDVLARTVPAGPAELRRSLARNNAVHGELSLPEILPSGQQWGAPTKLGDAVELLVWHLQLPPRVGGERRP